MSTLKLYTEEQVREAYFKGASDCHDKCINRNWRGVELAVDVKLLEELNNEYMDFQNPIELPSNDDLFKQAIKEMEEWYGSDCKEEIDAYFRGAKWMKNQLTK